MISNEIPTRVKKVIALVLKSDVSIVDDNVNIAFDLGVGSMQSITLIAGIARKFGIEM